MIPFEAAIMVVLLAVMSTMNAFFKESRWTSFVCLCLAVFGVAGLAGISEQFNLYFAFGPAVVIVFLIATLFSRPFQKLVLAFIGAGILFGMMWVASSSHDFFDKAAGQLMLFAGTMLLPVFVGSVFAKDEIRVEKLVSLQQFWVRVLYLAWCRENAVNFRHYDFIGDWIVGVTAVAGAIMVFRILFLSRTWFLSARSFVSLAILAGGLTFEVPELRFLFLWTLFLALIDMVPEVGAGRDQGLLRRFGIGAFGGAASWGLMFFIDQVTIDITLKAAWAVMIFGLGYLALVRPGREVEAPAERRWIAVLGYTLQAGFFSVIVFWPLIKKVGGA